MQDEPVAMQLKKVIDRLPPQGVNLAEILALTGEGGLLIVAALLSLVFLIPVSIPGVSTVFGAAILLIGASRLLGKKLWLPDKVQKKTIASDKLREVLTRALVWLHRLEKICKPNRHKWLAAGKPFSAFNNSMLVLGAVLLMAPFGLIPFSNTLPALAILCLALGLLQRDGVCILLGYAANLSTIIYFGALITGGGMALQEALRHFSG